MGKSKIFLCCVCAGLVVFFTSCRGESNGFLLNHVLQEKDKQIVFMEYQKEDSVSYLLTDEKEVDALLEQLDRVPAKAAEEWPSDLFTLPIYGVAVVQADEEEAYEPHVTYGYWSNGYWITPDGVAYELELPVENIKKDYAWEETNTFSSVTEAGKIGPLVSDANGWKKEFLTEALPAAPLPGLVTEVTKQGEELTVTIENQSEQIYMGDKYDYVLEVSLDGIWYEIPLSVWQRYEKGDIPAVYPGEKRTIQYSLAIYDSLPEGTYRLVTGSGERRECLAEFVLTC